MRRLQERGRDAAQSARRRSQGPFDAHGGDKSKRLVRTSCDESPKQNPDRDAAMSRALLARLEALPTHRDEPNRSFGADLGTCADLAR